MHEWINFMIVIQSANQSTSQLISQSISQYIYP